MAEDFVFKGTWAKAIAGLPDQVRLEVYDAIVGYGTTGKLFRLKAMAGAVFEFVKQDIDAQKQHSEYIYGVRAKAAKKKADLQSKKKAAKMEADLQSKNDFAEQILQTPAKNILQTFAENDLQAIAETAENEPLTSHNRKSPSKKSIDSINSIESKNNNIIYNNNNKNKENAQKKEKESSAAFAAVDAALSEASTAAGSSSKAAIAARSEAAAPGTAIDARAFVAYFCSAMEAAKAVIPHRCAYTERRAQAIKARCREYGKEALKCMVEKAARSDFLNGRSGNSWTASLDWLLRPNNFVKVVEGNYDNKNQTGNGNINKWACDKQATDACRHEAADYEQV